MTRTLTASPPVPVPTDVSDALIDAMYYDAETTLWRGISELWEYGKEYQPLAEKTLEVDAWLGRAKAWIDAHPDHAQREEWARRVIAAEARNQGRKDRLEIIDWEARIIREGLAAVWRRIPEARRKEIRKNPGFPRPASVARLGPELWVMAKTGRPSPDGVPF